MDHIVNRESVGMRTFSSEAVNIAEEMENVCSQLKQELYTANSYMQDGSGQEAISIVSDLVEETMGVVNYMRLLSAKIRRSAELLEESDTLL